MNVDLAKLAEIDDALKDENTAHLMIDVDKVVSKRSIKGIKIETKEIKDGVEVKLDIAPNTVIKKPVHLCFGSTKENILQKIKMNIHIGKNAKVSFFSHCIFPKGNAKHIMDAKISIDENASYSYIEKHIHSFDAKVEIKSMAKVKVAKNAKYVTEFELIQGRAGNVEIDYEAEGGENSVIEMTTKASGWKDDIIKVKEDAVLKEKSRGALKSRIAVRENAQAEIYNKIVALEAYARGHVDCKEIIKGNAKAIAIPVVEVRHPKAHVTHEAAIGSVDRKQLETLMARGLGEEEATELIIEGLLK